MKKYALVNISICDPTDNMHSYPKTLVTQFESFNKKEFIQRCSEAYNNVMKKYKLHTKK